MTAAELAAGLEGVRPAGSGWTARCPAHEDSRASLSISEGADGRVLLHCHAGCAPEDVAAAAGVEMTELFADGGRGNGGGFTLDTFAANKRLPLAFLEAQGLATGDYYGRPCVDIPYRDQAGDIVCTRKRIAASAADGSRWPKGTRPAPYGLDHLSRADPGKAVILVEGESDALTCWHHSVTALGIPGANAWRSEWAHVLEGRHVVAWREPDAAGETFIASLARDLPGLKVIRPDDGVKDASELHLAHGDGFRARLTELWKAATPASAGNDKVAAVEDGWVASARLVILADVMPERVRWLWPGRIPLGKLTILDGDPGLGKSTLTLDLAARLSRGDTMPDGSAGDLDGAAGAVILTAEDGLADTVRPRLDAAGADTSLIAALRFVESEGRDRLPTVFDVDAIEEAIAHVGARLLIVDPLVAYMGAETNSYRDQDVRYALAGLAELAERLNLAVLAVRHLNKMSGGNPLYRGGGSIGLIAAARSGLLVAPDPEDETAARRILASTKSNLAAPPPSLAFHLEPVDQMVRVAWAGETTYTAADLLSTEDPEERSAVDEARAFLLEELASGRQPAADVKRNANKIGIAERTLKRAKRKLAIEVERDGFGTSGTWYWRLPIGGPKGATIQNLAPYGGRGGREPLQDAGSTIEGQGVADLAPYDGPKGAKSGSKGANGGKGWPPLEEASRDAGSGGVRVSKGANIQDMAPYGAEGASEGDEEPVDEEAF